MSASNASADEDAPRVFISLQLGRLGLTAGRTSRRRATKVKPCFSERLYRERNLIDRFFSELKHFRRVATRYDKLAANFLAMVQFASMRLWLRAYES